MLSRKNRLTKRGSFAYAYKKGATSSAKILKMYFVRGQGVRIGFSVSNKIGKATVRNKVKRRLRAAARELLPQIVGGCQIVFLAREGIVEADYSAIKRAIFDLLSRSGLIKE